MKGDAYKTLFVGNLSEEVSESKLRREFGKYGDLVSVTLISDAHGEFKGYGFVEYERERDLKRARERTNGTRLYGKRILVDVERGRTVRGWMPMRLGGGLGNKRDGPKKKDSGVASRTQSSRGSSYRSDYGAYRSRPYRDYGENRNYDSRRRFDGGGYGSENRSHRSSYRDRSRSRERSRRYNGDRRETSSRRSRSRSRERRRRR